MNLRRFPLALALSLLLTAVPAFAASRVVTITAPPSAKAGSNLQVSVVVSTDAADGEQIGFLHAEYSVDGGKTWVPVYAENAGRAVSRDIDFQTRKGEAKALVRVRVAFRGGKAGDVGFDGAPIAWDKSWGKWQTPPAKTVAISLQP